MVEGSTHDCDYCDRPMHVWCGKEVQWSRHIRCQRCVEKYGEHGLVTTGAGPDSTMCSALESQLSAPDSPNSGPLQECKVSSSGSVPPARGSVTDGAEPGDAATRGPADGFSSAARCSGSPSSGGLSVRCKRCGGKDHKDGRSTKCPKRRGKAKGVTNTTAPAAAATDRDNGNAEAAPRSDPGTMQCDRCGGMDHADARSRLCSEWGTAAPVQHRTRQEVMNWESRWTHPETPTELLVMDHERFKHLVSLVF